MQGHRLVKAKLSPAC